MRLKVTGGYLDGALHFPSLPPPLPSSDTFSQVTLFAGSPLCIHSPFQIFYDGLTEYFAFSPSSCHLLLA